MAGGGGKLLTGYEERKIQNPHPWKAKSAAPRGERNSRSLAPLGMTSARVGTKDKRGARQTHERPTRLLPNSSCTSVDHLLTRQERRSPNVRNISRGVNAFCGRGTKLCTSVAVPGRCSLNRDRSEDRPLHGRSTENNFVRPRAGLGRLKTRWRDELAATTSKVQTTGPQRLVCASSERRCWLDGPRGRG